MIHRRALPLLFAAACAAAGPAVAQTAGPSATDAVLGEPFQSQVDGLSFRPPAGGKIIRQLGSGDVVRFVYADRGWDVRLKAIPNSARLPLATPAGDPGHPGLLDLTAGQLTNRAGVAAEVLRKEVVPVGSRPVGLIEARDSAGINRFFTQQALIPDGTTRYFVLQMLSPAQPAAGAAGPAPAVVGPAQEGQAREAFQRVLATFQVLDRSALRQAQVARLMNTHQFYLQTDQRRVEAVLQPVRFMRVVRDGQDVGYVQVNERPEQHHGRDGYAVVVRSHVESSAAATPPPDAGAAGPTTPAVDLPKQVGPAAAPVGATGPSQVDGDSDYFATFDRGHEEWTIVTRPDNRASSDQTEMGSSDLEVHRRLDAAKSREAVRLGGAAGGRDKEPPVVEHDVYTLSVDNYAKVRKGKPVEQPLPVYYLPEAMAQLLPRLLPAAEPRPYLFAFYVSAQRAVLLRYVDVGVEREVELDGRQVRAVPITDRVGVDGVPTVHYVTRDGGQWLGSVSDGGKLLVLPTDESALAERWHGFKQLPDPPVPTDEAPGRRLSSRDDPPAQGPVEGPRAPLPSALEPGGFDGR